MVKSVLAVLGGAALDLVASDLGIATPDLEDAVQTYQEAGRTALTAQGAARDWYQVHVEFPNWESAEKTAIADLGPELQRLQKTGVVAAWWYIRKAPCWRLRIRPGRTVDHQGLAATVNSILDGLTTAGVLSDWRRTLYEPEAAAFGGRVGMAIAHELFCSDSDEILAFLRLPAPIIGRRELSILLCSKLFRAAGQEWFECGDVWSRVALLRPMSSDVSADRLVGLSNSLRKLLVSDVRPDGTLFGTDGPLAFAKSWAAAFERAGRALRAAADQGVLERGTREVLAYHVIFHWNRFGLRTTTQSVLANVANEVVLGS